MDLEATSRFEYTHTSGDELGKAPIVKTPRLVEVSEQVQNIRLRE